MDYQREFVQLFIANLVSVVKYFQRKCHLAKFKSNVVIILKLIRRAINGEERMFCELFSKSITNNFLKEISS